MKKLSHARFCRKMLTEKVSCDNIGVDNIKGESLEKGRIMKKVEVEQAKKDVARRVYFDFKAGKVKNHDDLLAFVDGYLEQAGLTSFEHGDDVLEMIKDDYKLAICDCCGAVIKDADRVDVGDCGALRSGIIVMSRAGEKDYLRDDIMGVEVICKHCEHWICDYIPDFSWGGSVYASQAELDADVAKLEAFKARGWADLDELPRPLVLDLKQRELDNKRLEENDETASLGELLCAEYLMSDAELEERVGGCQFSTDDFNVEIPLF